MRDPSIEQRILTAAADDEEPAKPPSAMGLDLLQNLNIPRRQTVKDKARHSRRSGRALIYRLTAEATGLEFVCGAPESSSFGNFAVQLTTLEGQRSDKLGVNAERVSEWAGLLTSVALPNCHSPKHSVR